jgi:cytochrome P450
MDLFSDEGRRNPYPFYAHLQAGTPLLRVPPPFDAWMVFDYDTVKWILNDHQTFSSRVPAPQWFIFFDPPEHAKLRALVSRAFTPKTIADLEPAIRNLARELLDAATERQEMDFAEDYSVPLAMKVIAGMIGIPREEWVRYRQWSDVIMRLSYSRSGGEEAERSLADFIRATEEMNAYLTEMIEQRRESGQDDLLTRLIHAEVDGQKLTQREILGFFQLLVVGGQETTANLINNAIICLLEHPDQLASLRAKPELLPSTIEEVLRYRSPFQWTMRTPRRDAEVHGQIIPAGQLVLPMIGAANRDPQKFRDAQAFDIARDPNPHIAFGHGIHFCIGAALARMEARIALSEFLGRVPDFDFASDQPWEPRKALNVHGPARLPIRFQAHPA